MLSILEVVSPELVKCILCPQTWFSLQNAIEHDHGITDSFEIIEFEGQHIAVDSIGMPARVERGFRCGECKMRHHSIKAIKLCHFTAADHKAEQEACYRAEMAYERHLEDRGADEAAAQDAYEARMGVISFGQAWHNESPETCPCCN